MRKIDEYYAQQIKSFPSAILFCSFFIVIGILFLRPFSGGEGNLIVAIFCFAIGGIVLGINIKLLISFSIKKAQIKRVMQLGTSVMAKVENQKDKLIGTAIICSAEINGVRYEFESEPTDLSYAVYACQELGIEGLTVYVNMQNPKEYVVDVRELEDRVVDLT